MCPSWKRSRLRSAFRECGFSTARIVGMSTALARDEEGVPWLVRTLDWPFSGLGRHLEVVHMRGPAGEFFNVSWPGYAGVLTATAPGRFAAAINQAPLRRRTERPWLRPYDIAANLAGTWRLRSYPPDHLLRELFETCAEYAEAKHRLETASLARPVIFTLIGCQSGERCVIERTEEDHRTYLDHMRPPMTGGRAADHGKRALPPTCSSGARTKRRSHAAALGARPFRRGHVR